MKRTIHIYTFEIWFHIHRDFKSFRYYEEEEGAEGQLPTNQRAPSDRPSMKEAMRNYYGIDDNAESRAGEEAEDQETGGGEVGTRL